MVANITQTAPHRPPHFPLHGPPSDTLSCIYDVPPLRRPAAPLQQLTGQEEGPEPRRALDVQQLRQDLGPQVAGDDEKADADAEQEADLDHLDGELPHRSENVER